MATAGSVLLLFLAVAVGVASAQMTLRVGAGGQDIGGVGKLCTDCGSNTTYCATLACAVNIATANSTINVDFGSYTDNFYDIIIKQNMSIIGASDGHGGKLTIAVPNGHFAFDVRPGTCVDNTVPTFYLANMLITSNDVASQQPAIIITNGCPQFYNIDITHFQMDSVPLVSILDGISYFFQLSVTFTNFVAAHMIQMIGNSVVAFDSLEMSTSNTSPGYYAVHFTGRNLALNNMVLQNMQASGLYVGDDERSSGLIEVSLEGNTQIRVLTGLGLSIRSGSVPINFDMSGGVIERTYGVFMDATSPQGNLDVSFDLSEISYTNWNEEEEEFSAVTILGCSAFVHFMMQDTLIHFNKAHALLQMRLPNETSCHVENAYIINRCPISYNMQDRGMEVLPTRGAVHVEDNWTFKESRIDYNARHAFSCNGAHTIMEINDGGMAGNTDTAQCSVGCVLGGSRLQMSRVTLTDNVVSSGAIIALNGGSTAILNKITADCSNSPDRFLCGPGDVLTIDNNDMCNKNLGCKNPSSGPDVGAIVGGVMAALVVVLVAVAGYFYYKKRKHSEHQRLVETEQNTYL